MIDWPTDLVTDIARRQCVIYIGAGVSANSKAPNGMSPPTWKKFLSSALENVHDDKSYATELLDKNDMLMACDVIIDKLGERQFNDFAQDAFRRPGFQPSRMHEVIYDLDSRLVISPNVDKIYDQYALLKSSSTVVIKQYCDQDIPTFIRSQDRVILKAHGSIDYPRQMIFSKHQYNNARYQFGAFYKLLDALMLTHTYVFIGCGFNDPDIQLVLENYNFGFPGCRPHYFVTAEENINTDISNNLSKNCNIKVLTYSNRDNTHSELLQSLEKLVDLVESKRDELAGTQNW